MKNAITSVQLVARLAGPVVMAAGLPAPVAVGQNLVSNPSFETPAAGASFVSRNGAGAMGAWNVAGGIDHIGGFWQAADGAQSVDLNSASAGTVSQTLATVPGRTYLLRYSLSENFFGTANKTLNVLWNGVSVQAEMVVHDPLRTQTSMLWQERSLVVTAASASTVLAFQSTTGAMNGSQGFTAFYGPALDNVRVTATCGRADVAGPNQSIGPDASLTADDIIVFLSWYFAADSRANVAGANQSTVPDSQFTADDIIVFLGWYFAGC